MREEEEKGMQEGKTMREEVEVLCRRSMFSRAINLLKSHVKDGGDANRYDVDHLDTLLADIYRQYGDSLYQKGDFEGAVNQYVKTIGFTEPSYVIRHFLDPQRIANLTTYLQELHAQGLANSDHTTLLLNCFAKLKDVTSLDKFIRRPPQSKPAPDSEEGGHVDDDLDDLEHQELPFDLDTAIRVCRQAGYYEHAGYLARRYGRHDEYIRNQIEDRQDLASALKYIRTLPAPDAEKNLLRYGRTLLTGLAADTTDLLIELCSGIFQPQPTIEGTGVRADQAETSRSSAAAYLSYLQVGPFGKSAPKAIPPGDQQSGPKSIKSIDQDTSLAATAAPPIPAIDRYSSPSPDSFFSLFIAHPLDLQRFLETVALARWGQSLDTTPEEEEDMPDTLAGADAIDSGDSHQQVQQQRVWNTLLELYLNDPAATTTDTSSTPPRQTEKALRLLQCYRRLPYDIHQALLICSFADFTKGVVFLYERLGMYADIMRLYMDQDEAGLDDTTGQRGGDDQSDLMKCLDRYGRLDPQLYVMLLRHLSGSARLLNRHQEDLMQVLAYIEEERLLSPLEVVQTLSKDRVASVGVIRDYLIRSIQSQQIDVDANTKLTATYQRETQTKLEEIASLRSLDQPKVFQQTRCNACSGSLDLPIVHFMCKHSFHSRCLSEEEKECPVCAQSHKVILEIRRNNLLHNESAEL